MNWHLLPLSEVMRFLNTNPDGITTSIASKILIKKGKNLLKSGKKKSILQLFLHQFMDFMIVILIIAAIISGIIGDKTDSIIILAIIFLNAIIGFIQQYRAEKAMDALKKLTASNATVLRDGKKIDVPTQDLVPGDVVLLEAGNSIPADVRFFETHHVKVDESALTGESNNVEKNAKPLPEGEYVLAERTNMGYKGTFITNGRALAYVVETGMNTELGRIAKLVQTEELSTPLQKKLSSFGKRLTIYILAVCVLFFGIGMIRGEELLTILMTSISLAVAAVPEALPALVTIALALGAKRLMKSKALIRKLPAVETLGSVTYICTDKTGTLTLNKMTVQEIVQLDDHKFEIFFSEKNLLLMAMALNNDVSKNGDEKLIGDSTEVALVEYAAENDFIRSEQEKLFPRLAELPFNSQRKCMTTLHQTERGIVAITKGAVDVLFGKLIDEQKDFIPEFENKVNAIAEKGHRVLGYALRFFPDMPENLNPDTIESSLTLIGFAGMIDPPREEAKKAVNDCKKAGIIPVMITGDHELTAKCIAQKLGIISSDEDLLMNGSELATLSAREFESKVKKVRVYARVSPEQKLKIITALQAQHHLVAMTGDGVNDAPALKNADIGIAMGINGTEVSKEASHMILLDDNFATILIAVKHGRRIFDNILKFIKYIMTGNPGEIWAIILAPLLGLPIPLLPIHILWINLVSDGAPGLALASEPADKNTMNRPPRNPDQTVFSSNMIWHVLFYGFLIGIATVGIQTWAIKNDNPHWQTMTFTVLCFIQLAHVMAIRSEKESIFKIGLFSNKNMLAALLITVALQLMIIYTPFFNAIFKTEALTFYELSITIAVASSVFWIIEFEKWIRRFIANKK